VPVTIAVDSAGIKVSNRGEWVRHKWKVKRGFIKVHIAVDMRTKQIIAMEITKEEVSDGRMLERLVDDSARKADVKQVMGDGTYDSRKNFRFLAERGIEPVIKVRKNSSFKAMGCMPRRVAVVEQLGNAGWMRTKGYGYRWMAESAFSAVKRVFGEHISSIKWGNIVKELLLKASIYNLFMAMNP
jgi:transposase